MSRELLEKEERLENENDSSNSLSEDVSNGVFIALDEAIHGKGE